MNTLDQEFNVETVQREIKTFKEIFDEIKEIPNPDQTIAAVIEKASIILDLVHSEMENEGASARYAEVAAQLLNTIVQSSTALNDSIQRLFDNKMRTISSKQKDKELEIKEFYYKSKQIGDTPHNNNLILTDSSSILKFLEQKNQQ
jgi:hypothetical protein